MRTARFVQVKQYKVLLARVWKCICRALVPSGISRLSRYALSRYSATTCDLDTTAGLPSVGREGSTITGSVYHGLPPVEVGVGDIPILCAGFSMSRYSSQMVLCGMPLS